MKVILLQELKGRGGEGDVIEVARGFAVNYLMPRKVAIEATKGNLKQLEMRSKNIKVREEGRLSDAEKLAASLADKVVTVEAKVGDEGRLFGSVTSTMIEAAIVAQLGIELDKRKIETHGHIKTAGMHPVTVAIYRDVKAELSINVVGEGHTESAPVAETVVPEVEGEEAEPVVVSVEDTAEQAETDVAVDEAVETESVEAEAAE